MTDPSKRKVLEHSREEMMVYARLFRSQCPQITQEQLQTVLHLRFVEGNNPLGHVTSVRLTGMVMRLPVFLDDIEQLSAEDPWSVADFMREVAKTIVDEA